MEGHPMDDADNDLGHQLERLADGAPPSPCAAQIRDRLRARRRRNAVAVCGLFLAIGAPLAVLARPAIVPSRVAIVVARPHPLTGSVPIQPQVTAIDPGMGSAAVVAAIVACLKPSVDAQFELSKTDGMLLVNGATPVSLASLKDLDRLLDRINALDLRFTPGSPPHLRLLLASNHA
jgi:hypothetical protein